MPSSPITNTSPPILPPPPLPPIMPTPSSVTASTSGIWISVKDKGDKTKSNLSGINTNQVNWGTPYTPDNPQNRQSAYRFDGLTQTVLPLTNQKLV